MRFRHRRALALGALATVSLALAACGSSSEAVPPYFPPPPVVGHSQIVLKDQAGNPLALGSTTAYSPRQTCGACHTVDDISNAYHFQQGRTFRDKTIPMKDNYFADGRTWLKSAGMYGKW